MGHRRLFVLGLCAMGVAAGCASVPEYPRTGNCEVPPFRAVPGSGSTLGRMTIVNVGKPCRIRHFSDADAQIPASSLEIVTPPRHGTVSVEAPNAIFYTPRPGFAGSDQFAYRASGSNRAGAPVSTAATIDVTVLAPRPQ
jgi:hypothetical protein